MCTFSHLPILEDLQRPSPLAALLAPGHSAATAHLVQRCAEQGAAPGPIRGGDEGLGDMPNRGPNMDEIWMKYGYNVS